ncbi:glycosyltransferase [Fulvivirga sediminis]|uniref:Glycosyltransferase n=1 Tax=Fulvivirga sediminis TaxID=2803949 RepID=A0A937K060_9BACT|nr:glycosyltransferase [Fulvivirga sediminis]MBL3655976.1 glycosyltransferase [Fulvivirga sediminis]
MSLNNDSTSEKILTEISWEVCNQVGGIYTVIRSKAPVMTEEWKDHYCLIGPYVPVNAATDFEPFEDTESIIGRAVHACRAKGFEVYHGRWLVSGRPQTVLFHTHSVMHDLGNIKYYYWKNHHIEFTKYDPLLDETMAFGYMVYHFMSELARECMEAEVDLLAHFHEWMAGLAIPEMRRMQMPVKTIFTTHATLLGRYLAMNDPDFYNHLPFLDWEYEAKHFDIETNVKLERACVHGAHIFTTVSEVTGRECAYLLGRSPDHILPNGLNIERFNVVHEVHNLHHEHKKVLEQFIMSHFFQSYSWDLGKTLYFFTSGRFEYLNKGYDLTLEALARLNWKLKENRVPMTVVMFFITKQPSYSINPDVLNSRAMLDKVAQNCDAIVSQIKEKLFIHAASSMKDHRLPDLNALVDDYWKLRYRRTIQSWKTGKLPSIVTHNIMDDGSDPILNYLRSANLVNNQDDKVKVVYHPDFVSSTNPLFGMEYGEFVRACHLGIFPSYYEPWGYTPLECLARGVSAVTSDLSGFGDYIKNVPLGDEDHGVFVVERANKSFECAAENLANILYNYVVRTSRTRVDMRTKSEDLSEYFDWSNLYAEYKKAYEMAEQSYFVNA